MEPTSTHLCPPGVNKDRDNFTLPETGILVICGVSLYACLCLSLRAGDRWRKQTARINHLYEAFVSAVVKRGTLLSYNPHNEKCLCSTCLISIPHCPRHCFFVSSTIPFLVVPRITVDWVQRYIYWREKSSGIWRRVCCYKVTDISEEVFASFFRIRETQ
jgi:hypothetical protein